MIEEAVKKATKRVLGEAEVPQAPSPAPPPQAPAQQAPASGPNDVSVSKVATGTPGASADANDLQKGQITIDMVIEKLNSVRSGRSFKDDNIYTQMSSYFNDLNDNEKLALYAFLKGIAQIVTGEIQGQQAMEPNKTAPELEVVEKPGSPGAGSKIKNIKPNVIKRQGANGNTIGQENTRAPSPIVPKQR